MTPSPQQQWEDRITEILDFIAETYCQLGESGKERTHPMKAGSAYLELINKAVAEIVIGQTPKELKGDAELIQLRLRAEQRLIIGGK